MREQLSVDPQGLPRKKSECAMKMEYRMAIRFNFSDDLFEGIRAFIIDKDFSPVWDPGTIESVCDKVVDEYFQEPDSGDIKFC